jgi:hypothetical protein
VCCWVYELYTVFEYIYIYIYINIIIDIYIYLYIFALYISFDLITHKSLFDIISQIPVVIERLEQLGLIAVDHQVPDGSW